MLKISRSNGSFIHPARDAVVDAFRSAMRQHGLMPPENILADGQIHRCDVEGKNGRDDGVYLLHLDGVPAGGFQNWKTGGWQDWCSRETQSLTASERAAIRARAETTQAENEAERGRRQSEAAARALKLWEAAHPAPADHPYLTKKGIQVAGLRVRSGPLIIREVDCDGALIAPLRDASGDLRSLEFISVSDKRFLPGGQKAGCYFSIGTPTDTLVITEGLATGASVHQATGYAVAVAFDAGNLLSVAQALREKFPAAKIVLAADNDIGRTGNVGVEKATQAARTVKGYVAIPELEGAACDFNDLAQGKGMEAVKMAIEAAHNAELAEIAGLAASESEPESLRRPLPPAEPYPIEALGPILSAAARRVHEVVQAPAALCGQSFLAAASLAAQPHADIEIDGRREPLSLFAVSIAESGERKTGVDRYALQAHRELERQALISHRSQLKEHELAVAIFESKRRLINKGSKDVTAEQIENALQQLGTAPAAPSSPILIATTPTLEGLHKLFAGGRPSLGLFHDDGGEFIGGHAMNEENRMKSAAGLSRLWDMGEFDRVRAGDGAQKYFGRRLASHLMIQPVIAERVLSDEVLSGQGLLARTLLAWPTSTIGDRPYVSIDLSADGDLTRYWRVMASLLALAPRYREGTEDELDPPALTLTPEARRVWVGVHDALETDQRSGGDFAGIRAWASKAPSQVLRIAGVLTLFEDHAARVVEAEAVGRAARLVDHYLKEAARIVGTASVPLEIRNAEKLRDWCHSERRTLLHSGAALQFGPAGIRTVEAFNAAIAVLERTGWVERIDGGCEIDGSRRRRAWRVRRIGA